MTGALIRRGGTSLAVPVVKNLPWMQEMQARSQVRELRSHMQHSVDKKKLKKKKKSTQEGKFNNEKLGLEFYVFF